MALILKAAAAALTAAVIALLIKKKNPEMALLLSVVTVAMILLASSGLLSSVLELREEIKRLTGGSDMLLAPVLKCLGVAIVTRIAVELCRDSAQNGAAAAVELAGTVCALSAVMPLLMSVLKMIGGMV